MALKQEYIYNIDINLENESAVEKFATLRNIYLKNKEKYPTIELTAYSEDYSSEIDFTIYGWREETEEEVNERECISNAHNKNQFKYYARKLGIDVSKIEGL